MKTFYKQIFDGYLKKYVYLYFKTFANADVDSRHLSICNSVYFPLYKLQYFSKTYTIFISIQSVYYACEYIDKKQRQYYMYSFVI